MEKLITRDNSVTFVNEEYCESYHSKTVGALEEAMVKYVEPAKIKDGMKILDFCFGLGYNSLAAIYVASDLKIIGLENDLEIVDKIKVIDVPGEFKDKYKIIKKLACDLKYHDKNYDIKLIIDDARNTLKKLIENKEMFDAVLFDPFSPKVCPHLWTQDIFDNLAKVMKKKSRLTTYSCATHVREKLKKAGFNVIDGPCFGRKSPSTIGEKK
ncbi:MAG: tRNA (5-methylaminomethyl-2-thiouridine)(34)-methyltransferase MnmD [Nanoarchaeota archaeon]